MRNSNYIIIRPDGSVITPIDVGTHVNEVVLGSLLNLPLHELIQKWEAIVDERPNTFYSLQRFSDVGV